MTCSNIVACKCWDSHHVYTGAILCDTSTVCSRKSCARHSYDDHTTDITSVVELRLQQLQWHSIVCLKRPGSAHADMKSCWIRWYSIKRIYTKIQNFYKKFAILATALFDVVFMRPLKCRRPPFLNDWDWSDFSRFLTVEWLKTPCHQL